MSKLFYILIPIQLLVKLERIYLKCWSKSSLLYRFAVLMEEHTTQNALLTLIWCLLITKALAQPLV